MHLSPIKSEREKYIAGVQDHLSHGDWAGPYQSCPQNLIALSGDVAIASGHAVSNELTLFPNPTSHQINILFSRQAPKATLRISDVLGKLMFTKELEEGVDRVVFDLDNGHFKNGIYLVSLSENGKTITIQMVVLQEIIKYVNHESSQTLD